MTVRRSPTKERSPLKETTVNDFFGAEFGQEKREAGEEEEGEGGGGGEEEGSSDRTEDDTTETEEKDSPAAKLNQFFMESVKVL